MNYPITQTEWAKHHSNLRTQSGRQLIHLKKEPLAVYHKHRKRRRENTRCRGSEGHCRQKQNEREGYECMCVCVWSNGARKQGKNSINHQCDISVYKLQSTAQSLRTSMWGCLLPHKWWTQILQCINLTVSRRPNLLCHVKGIASLQVSTKGEKQMKKNNNKSIIYLVWYWKWYHTNSFDFYLSYLIILYDLFYFSKICIFIIYCFNLI